MKQIDERHPHRGDWLREIVFGLNDDLVTTLVFIMVISGLASTHLVLVILSEVLAGGVAMTLGGYLSACTEKQILDHCIEIELYGSRRSAVSSTRRINEQPITRFLVAIR